MLILADLNKKAIKITGVPIKILLSFRLNPEKSFRFLKVDTLSGACYN